MIRSFGTYENWLQKCNNFKILIENTLSRAVKIREKTFNVRIQTANDLRTQNDIIEYAQRTRVYDTERCKTELEWQKSTVSKTM